MTGNALLAAAGVHVAYGRREIVSGVDVRLDPDSDIALVGRSGSGKTTLLLALAGLLPLTAGRIERDGLARNDIAVVFQSPSLIPELSALENVALPLRLAGTHDVAEARQRAADVLRELGITTMNTLPGELSGGQQQRIAVARVLAGSPRVVLADEPTGALDPETAQRVLSALRANRDRVGGALLVATHDLTIAAALTQRISLSDGRLTTEAA